MQGLNVPVGSSVSDNLAVKAKGRGRGRLRSVGGGGVLAKQSKVCY